MKNAVWILCLKNNVARSAGRVWRKPGREIVHFALSSIIIIFLIQVWHFHWLPLFKTPLSVWQLSVLLLSSATIFKWLCATKKISENCIKRTKDNFPDCFWVQFMVSWFPSAFQCKKNLNAKCCNDFKIRACFLEIIRYFFFKVWITYLE